MATATPVDLSKMVDRRPPGEEKLALAQHVKRALAAIPPAAWQAFIEDLKKPTPAPVPVAVTPPPPPAPREAPELNDPLHLAERLLQMCHKMTAEQRRQVMEKLGAAGFVAEVPVGDIPADVIDEVKKRVGLTSADHLDILRLMELFTVYHDVICSIQPVMRETWKAVAQGSRAGLQSGPQLKRLASRFVAGDETANGEQLEQELQLVRKVAAGLIAAIGHVGRNFANGRLSLLSPGQIQQLVLAEGGRSLFGGMDAKCWTKYCELAAQMDAATVEREIMSAIGDYAAQVVEGPAR